MKTDYEKTMHHVWMMLEVDRIYEEDYQMRMLSDNRIMGLLEVRGQGTNEKSTYRYEITNKTAIKELWRTETWGYEELERFVRQLIQTLYELGNYLLDLNSLSLNPEHIYRTESCYYFCYIPGERGDFWRAFHVLMEEFVRVMDYSDKEGIYLAYELHKASMEESYDMEQVLEEILEKKELEMERVSPKKKRVVYDAAEEEVLDDWAGEQEVRGNAVRERQSVWGFVSKKMRKRHQEEWEELEYLTNEEQL